MKPILKAATALALVAVLGALMGIFADRTLRAADAEVVSAADPEACAARGGHEHRRRRARNFRSRIVEQLDLTPEQEARMDSLLAVQHREVANIRRISRERTDSVAAETRRQFDDLLDDEQRAALREMVRDARHRREGETRHRRRPYGGTRPDTQNTAEGTNQ